MASSKDNLIPQAHVLTLEEQSAGGKASVEARRQKKAMREMLEMCLEMTNNSGKTYRELATLGLIKGAMKGNAQNYRTILETLGELNAQDEEQNKQDGIINDLLEALNNAKKD